MILDRHGDIDVSPLALREVDRPEPGPAEVRVQTRVCAICRTDLHVIEGDLPARKLPIIPGHQVVGVVDQVGEGCSRLAMGQRVGIAWLRYTDGTCRYCRRGQENLCASSRYTGYDEHGGYAEFATVPEAFAYELPESFSDVEAAPLLCAGLIGYRALKRSRVPEGGKLLLVGFGSSAHMVIQIAVHRGYKVYVVTRSERHQRLSESLGAVWAGDALNHLPEKMDSAILFAPIGTLVPPTLEALDRGGTLSLAGIHMTDVPGLNYEKHLFQEKQLCSVTANTREDGRELLAEAAAATAKPHVELYPLADANRALQDLKHSRIDGTGVLVMRRYLRS
jgi:propanol-preferring alcohol dehydrogenase